MSSKAISLQQKLVKTSVLSSVAAGLIAFILLVGIALYQSMNLQDELMDEIADALLIGDQQASNQSQITQLSEEFDLQYQLLHQQQLLAQSENFDLAPVVDVTQQQHDHFDYV